MRVRKTILLKYNKRTTALSLLYIYCKFTQNTHARTYRNDTSIHNYPLYQHLLTTPQTLLVDNERAYNTCLSLYIYYIVIPSMSVAQNTGKSNQIIDFLKNFSHAFPRYEFSFRSGRDSGAFSYTTRAPLHKVDTKLQTNLVRFHTYREHNNIMSVANYADDSSARIWPFVYDKMVSRLFLRLFNFGDLTIHPIYGTKVI